MTLDSNAWIGIVLVAALVVAGIAVWKGKPFWAKGLGFQFGTPETKPPKIQVANNLKGVDLRAGNIVGTTSDGSNADVDVANKATFKRAELGDIIGAGAPRAADNKERPPAASDRPTKR